jgi:NADPH:quinone reductase
MRAARVHAWGEPPTVDEIDRPAPAAGESLIRVEAAAVAHLDATVAGGDFGITPELPYVGGVEGAGVVVDSSTFAAGTRVILRGGGLGLLRDGTWAEYVVVKDKALTALPEGLSPEIGATFWVPTTTADVALHQVGRLGGWSADLPAAEEHVIVAGAAGAVGSMVVQLALRAGARVSALVADEAQKARVADLGEVEIVSAEDGEALALLAQERSGSLLVDTLGGSELVTRARWISPGGRAVVIGYVAGDDVRLGLSNWLLDDVALLPVNMIRREAEARAALPALAELLATGALRLDYEVFDLADTGRALELLREGKVRGRAVVLPG